MPAFRGFVVHYDIFFRQYQLIRIGHGFGIFVDTGNIIEEARLEGQSAERSTFILQLNKSEVLLVAGHHMQGHA